MDLQSQIHTWDNLQAAYGGAARGKRGRVEVASFELYLADRLLELQEELKAKTYWPGPYRSFYVHEPKRRLISAAPFRDRVVHHALCHITVPYFEQRFLPDSYANRIGRGTHRALDRCQQFARRFRYVLQCDVVQYFPGIDHAILKDELCKLLPDNSLLWLIERILASGQGVLSEEYRMVYFPGDDLFAIERPRGLPIGNLTSQWWANCYLNAFDQFAKRELICPGYLRYVDDFLLFSNSKQDLWRWRDAIVRRLARYRLTIHAATAIPRPVTDGIPFLGFVVFPDHRRLKRNRGIAYRRKLKHLLLTEPTGGIKASILGWINHVRYADTFGLRRKLLSDFGLLYGENDARTDGDLYSHV